MSDHGPPSQDQVKAYYSSQSRTANWVSRHSSPPPSRSSSRPPTVRSSSQSSSRPSSRAASRPRGNSLPPPPAGFKYAPANTPVVYKTQAATYTVVTTDSKNVIVTSGDGRQPSKHRHSTPANHHHPARQQTYPQTSHKHSSSHTSSNTRHPSRHSSSKHKEKPLLQRIFSLGSSKGRQRRNSTGDSNNGFAIKW